MPAVAIMSTTFRTWLRQEFVSTYAGCGGGTGWDSYGAPLASSRVSASAHRHGRVLIGDSSVFFHPHHCGVLTDKIEVRLLEARLCLFFACVAQPPGITTAVIEQSGKSNSSGASLLPLSWLIFR